MMQLYSSHIVSLDSRVRWNDGNKSNRGIRPESLPPAEDVKKLERRLASAEKIALKNPEALEDGE